MHDTLSGRAEELGRLTDLIRTSLSLADSSIPAINEQLDELAAMGLDNLELEGPLVYSRAAGCSPNFDDARVVFAATLVMPGGLGCTIWSAEEYAERYGESGHEPPDLRERFAPYDRLPAIVRATLPAHAPKLLVQLKPRSNWPATSSTTSPTCRSRPIASRCRGGSPAGPGGTARSPRSPPPRSCSCSSRRAAPRCSSSGWRGRSIAPGRRPC